MTANVYLVEYKSFGGRKLGGPDDIGGALPQFPGEFAVKPRKIAVTTGTTIDLNPNTTFIKFQTYDADVLFNFDDAGHGSIDDDNGDRATPGQILFQGVVGNRDTNQFFTKINFKEVT